MRINARALARFAHRVDVVQIPNDRGKATSTLARSCDD
jgi:hypothetical protein